MDRLQKTQELTEQLYRKIMDEIDTFDRLLTVVRQAASPLDPEEIEELERSAFALQIARDVLENRVTPGKKMTITYPKGQLILE